MTKITTDTAREQQIEAHIVGTIVSAETTEDCGRDLAALANVCPPPLHRWFTAHLHRVLALAMDEALAGTIRPTGDAIAERASGISHSDALDLLRGRRPHADVPCQHEDSALANAGGWSAIADLRRGALDFIGSRGVAANVKALRHAGDRRTTIDELRRVAAEVAGSDLAAGPYEAIGRHRERLLGLIAGSADRNLGDCLNEALQAGAAYAALRERGQAPAATWGIRELDLLCPMRPGGLYVLAAAPKAGKTSLALQSATAVADGAGQGAVAIASLEMTGAELATIVAGRQLGIAPAAIRERSPAVPAEAWDSLAALAATWQASSSVMVRDAVGSADRTTVDGLVAWLSQLRASAPQMSLAVVDYLQLLDPVNPRDTEYQRITHATRQLKRAAMSLRLPLLVLSQMNRAGRTQVKDRAGQIVGDPEPTLADLRGSGSIEQDADAVVFLHKIGRPDPNAASILVRATVAANRAGPEAVLDLWFHRRQQLFEVARAPGPNVDALRSRAARMASPPSDDEGAAFGVPHSAHTEPVVILGLDEGHNQPKGKS